MRLIDADLIKPHEQLEALGNGRYEEVKVAYMSDINSIPDADAVTITHAKMMTTDAYPHRIYCENCYRTLIYNEEYCFEINEFPKWCMWCGAKLDREE